MTHIVQADREGTFKARITEYGLRDYESGAAAITVRVDLLALWTGDEENPWEEWEQYGMFALGNLFVVKKDGTLNSKQVESVMKSCGWNGSFATIADGSWEPTHCQVVLRENEYKGEVDYQVAFVNPYDATPGGSLSNIDPAKAKALDNQYGSQLRALKGNQGRNGAPPDSKPPKAPAGKAPAGKPATEDPPQDDIPF